MFLIQLQNKKYKKNNHWCFIQHRTRTWLLTLKNNTRLLLLTVEFTPTLLHVTGKWERKRGSAKSRGSHIMSGHLGPVKSNHPLTYCKVIVRVLKMIYFMVTKIVPALEKHLQPRSFALIRQKSVWFVRLITWRSDFISSNFIDFDGREWLRLLLNSDFGRDFCRCANVAIVSRRKPPFRLSSLRHAVLKVAVFL